MAGMTIGKFAVVSTLGTGAHSTILHVRRNADFKNYALKIVKIDGEEEMKFLDQARHEFHVAQILHHPNLLKIFALEESRQIGERVSSGDARHQYARWALSLRGRPFTGIVIRPSAVTWSTWCSRKSARW